MTFLKLIFFIVIGWALVRWLARWISGSAAEKTRRSDPGTAGTDYESLTDQKIEDADYEDL